LALDGKIRDANGIIKQLEEALNTERENYRILAEGIEERISNALDTQRDELNVQLNAIVHSEQQRLSQVHEAAMVKQEEIYQKALRSQEQNSTRTREKLVLVNLKLD
jgi:hypothetical protein